MTDLLLSSVPYADKANAGWYFFLIFWNIAIGIVWIPFHQFLPRPSPSLSWMVVVCWTGMAMVRVTLTMIGKAAITYSYALIYLYTPEVYPTVVRGAGLGVGTMMSRIGGVVAPLIADLVSPSSLHLTILNSSLFTLFQKKISQETPE